MNDHAPFLAAIREAGPDDDAPALIYGDWLEERGDDQRAEFLRLQIAASRAETPERADELLCRAALLLRKYGRAWAAELGLPPGVIWRKYRGGVIRDIEIRGVEPYGSIDAEWFAGTAIAAVRVSAISGDEGVATLSEQDWLITVAELRIISNDVGPAGVAALSRSSVLPALRRLDLRYNELGDEGMRELASGALADRIEALLLSENKIGPEGVAALAAPGRLGRLVELSLNFNDRLGDEGVAPLSDPAALPSLRHVELRGVGLTEAALEGLGSRVKGGTAFYLTSNRIRDERATMVPARPAPRVAWLLD